MSVYLGLLFCTILQYIKKVLTIQYNLITVVCEHNEDGNDEDQGYNNNGNDCRMMDYDDDNYKIRTKMMKMTKKLLTTMTVTTAKLTLIIMIMMTTYIFRAAKVQNFMTQINAKIRI